MCRQERRRGLSGEEGDGGLHVLGSIIIIRHIHIVVLVFVLGGVGLDVERRDGREVRIRSHRCLDYNTVATFRGLRRCRNGRRRKMRLERELRPFTFEGIKRLFTIHVHSFIGQTIQTREPERLGGYVRSVVVEELTEVFKIYFETERIVLK